MTATAYIRKEEYLDKTGKEYNDDDFPSLSCVPPSLLEIVSSIKLDQLNDEQMYIMRKIQMCPKTACGKAVIRDDSNEHLFERLKIVQEEMKRWKVDKKQ